MKSKKELNLYPFYDLGGMEDHLRAMAGKGWHLKKAGTLLWDYEKGEPEDLQYGVCWSGEPESYTPGKNQPGSFREQAKQSGWTPRVLSDRLQVYSADKDNEKPLSVSPYDRIMGVQQAAKPKLFLYGTLIGLGILSILLLIFKMHIMPVAALASGFSLAVPIVLSLIAVYFLSDLILYFVLKNQAEIAAAGNAYFSPRLPMAKILSWVLLISLVILGLAAVTGGKSPMLGTFFIFLVAILGLLFILKALHTTAQGRSKALTVTVNVVLVAILVVGVTVAVTRINQADAGFRGTLPVSAQELGLRQEDDVLQDYSRSKSSGLLRYTEASQMKMEQDGTYTPVLSYELVEGRAMGVDGMVLDHYLSRMASSARKDPEGNIASVSYKSVDAGPWQAEKAWQMTDGTVDFNVYLVLYKNQLAELGVPEPLTEVQMTAFGRALLKK